MKIHISACVEGAWRNFNTLVPVDLFETWRADKKLSIDWLADKLKEPRLKGSRVVIWELGWIPL